MCLYLVLSLRRNPDLSHYDSAPVAYDQSKKYARGMHIAVARNDDNVDNRMLDFIVFVQKGLQNRTWNVEGSTRIAW